ncbi:DUF4817 domain-containing protein [Trichonephila clavipes]|nr:DUF4817 domain-containing protein [Trichonephila clavipes]
MAASSSSFIATPLAHVDNQGEGHPYKMQNRKIIAENSNHGQVTSMTPELAPLFPDYHTNGKTLELSSDLTRITPLRSGTRLECMTHRLLKNVKSGKGPLTPAGLLKLIKRFEETGKLEDRARAGRPCLREARAPCIAVEMEAITSEAASGTSSAREAAKRLGLPPSSVHNILRRILQLYPYKLQLCHELLPADTAQREAFAKWAFSKMEQDPTWVFNILWTDEAHFSLHGDVNNHNCRIWATSNPREYTQKSLHSPKVTAWCGFTGSFIIGPFFFEMQCPVNGWITETVNAQRYLRLLLETVVPCLIQRGQISNVTFMQDGATSHTANPVKAFLIQTFGEDRIVSRHCRYPWSHRSPDLTPADFWLWGYLKSHVYLSGPSSLLELKDAIR